jgi:hypothetical protein
MQEIDDLARTADASTSRVFLMSEDSRTRAACGGVLRTFGQIEGVLHKLDRDADGQSWDKLNEEIERAIGSGCPLPVEQPISAASRSAGQRSYPVCFASLAAR